MDRAVLDASAVMAFLRRERGAEKLTPALLSSSLISTVNLAEVQGGMIQKGKEAEEIWRDLCMIISIFEPFTAAQAKLAGSLITQTRSRGLSLGDRACLALAITLNVGCRIHVIR
jgi:PIN domain nuclease of toxin-antitoxin system